MVEAEKTEKLVNRLPCKRGLELTPRRKNPATLAIGPREAPPTDRTAWFSPPQRQRESLRAPVIHSPGTWPASEDDTGQFTEE